MIQVYCRERATLRSGLVAWQQEEVPRFINLDLIIAALEGLGKGLNFGALR